MSFLSSNVGVFDRVIRVAVVVPLLTGTRVGTCPLYTLLGLSTRPRDGRSTTTRTLIRRRVRHRPRCLQ